MARLFLLLASLMPLLINAQNEYDHKASIELNKFPAKVRKAIRFASDKSVTVRFALLSEEFELIDYNNPTEIDRYNRDIPLQELLNYYQQSHGRDYFGFDYHLLPFAVSTSHQHDDKTDFLAIVVSPEKQVNGKILYNNVDYTLNFPGIVAPGFFDLFEDFYGRINRAAAKGEAVVHFGLNDRFSRHAFTFPSNPSSQAYREGEMVIKQEKNAISLIDSRIEVIYPDGDDGQQIMMEFIIRLPDETIIKPYFVGDLYRLKYRGQEQYADHYVIFAERYRMYSHYLRFAHQLQQELKRKGINAAILMDSNSLSTAFRAALWLQREGKGKKRKSGGKLKIGSGNYRMAWGNDKTSLENINEDYDCETFIEQIKYKQINGLSENLVVEIIGVDPKSPTDRRMDVLAEVVADNTQSEYVGCVIRLTDIIPYQELAKSEVKAEVIASSREQLLHDYTYLAEDGKGKVAGTIKVGDIELVYSVGQELPLKRFLPFLAVRTSADPINYNAYLEGQFGHKFRRKRLWLSVAKQDISDQDQLFVVLREAIVEISKRDADIETLLGSLDLPQLIRLGYEG